VRVSRFLILFMTISASLNIGEKRADLSGNGVNRSSLEIVLLSSQFKHATRKVINCEVTAYCTQACCNSGFVIENGEPVFKDWSNMVAAGNVKIDKLMSAGVDIAAVDTSVIPFGSLIKYEGKLYAALDRGSLIRGHAIDLAMRNHTEANLFGRKKNEIIEIFIPQNPQQTLSVILGLAMKYAYLI